ncbi:MAG: amidohydrolase family protein [Bacteroidota bacterium]
MAYFPYLWLFLFLSGSCIPPSENAPPPPSEPIIADIWIKGGQVIDGSGTKAFGADVLIKDQNIVYIGATKGIEVKAAQIFSAEGMVVAPGFIDAHSHGGTVNYLAQGVTTLCLGQDGNSGNTNALLAKLESPPFGLPLNEAWWIGHGSLRDDSGIGSRRDPGIKLLDGMRAQLGRIMSAGAFGISTGLEYIPGIYADERELHLLAETVGRFEGVMVSHIRNEDDDQLFAALDELIGCGQFCHVHVSHIKSVYGKGEARAQEILNYLDQAKPKVRGLSADLYPYTASYSTIGLVFPKWARPPADYASVRRSRKQELLDHLRGRVDKRNGPEATLFGSGKYTGKTLAEVSAQEGRPFEENLMDIGPTGASAAYFVMDDTLQRALIQWPELMFCSDGSERMRHPRGYGSFAKIIQWTQEDLLPIETAIHKMTALPAETFGIEKRGKIIEGYYADVAIFAPEQIKARATFSEPHLLAEGMHMVIINGQIAWQEGKMIRKDAGQLLKKRWSKK